MGVSAAEGAGPTKTVCLCVYSGGEKIRIDFGHGDMADVDRKLVLPTQMMEFRWDCHCSAIVQVSTLFLFFFLQCKC